MLTVTLTFILLVLFIVTEGDHRAVCNRDSVSKPSSSSSSLPLIFCFPPLVPF
jgi:hypothetical protein